MSKFNGVGLLKLSNSPTFEDVEEFYVVAFRGLVVPYQFKSYVEAVAHYKKLVAIEATGSERTRARS